MLLFKFALVTYPKKTQSVLKGGNAALKGDMLWVKLIAIPVFWEADLRKVSVLWSCGALLRGGILLRLRCAGRQSFWLSFRLADDLGIWRQ